MHRTARSFALIAGVASVAACSGSAPPPAPAPSAPPPIAAAPDSVSVSGQAPSAQAPAGQPSGQPQQQAAAGAPQPPQPPPQAATQGGRNQRSYRQIIPASAVSQDGLFRTHQVDDRLYFEIPPEQLGREMVVVIRDMVEPAGGPTRFYRWERSGDRIRLWEQDYDVYADSSSNIAVTVNAMARGPLVASFNIETFSPDSAAVIDVTRLFIGNVPEFGAIRGLVQDRSFIEKVTTLDHVINVVATQTGMAQGGGEAGAASGPQAVTQRLHWSIAPLPDTPMRPRLHDSRIGFNWLQFIDYSAPEHATTRRRYIVRHRLEKRNPAAAVSDPIEPIVYYIDRATPEWLIPYVIAGVNQWRPAFEEAGFSNAIEGRLAPSAEEDPDFSLYDARHNAIYWRATTTENASGGGIADPRSGEILKGEVNIHHNVQNLLRNWYFTQVGPLDPRAQSLPFPDSLMGKLVEYVVAHEVGHSLGFPHNFKASAMYPADSLRNEDFLRRMGGHVPTLMDYSRFNYVVQPEDKIPADLLIPKIGPYDRYALKWGYAEISGAATAEDERPVLEQWARMQDTIPWLRFDTPGIQNDPDEVLEAVGNADAVNSSTLALRNLDRVMDMLLDVAEKPGEDYALLSELYAEAVAQWGRYNGHVAAMIGGAEAQEKRGTGPRFTPLTRQQQKAAMQWLKENAFTTPQRFLRQDILFRIEPEGSVNRIRNAQTSVLRTLLNETRITRLVEYEALNGPARDSYTPADLMEDLREGIWGELEYDEVQIDVYRRNLQRAHLLQMELLIQPPRPPGSGNTPPPAPPLASDTRPVLRAELREIDRRVASAIPRAADRMTRIHLEDVQFEIARILDGWRLSE